MQIMQPKKTQKKSNSRPNRAVWTVFVNCTHWRGSTLAIYKTVLIIFPLNLQTITTLQRQWNHTFITEIAGPWVQWPVLMRSSQCKQMLIWSQTSPTPFLWRQTYSYLPSFEASPPFLKYRIILCTVSEQLARPPSRRKCTQRRQKNRLGRIQAEFLPKKISRQKFG